MAAGLRRRAAVAGAAAVMAAYCLACEGGASVGRAGIVGGLGLVAELRSSPRERWYLLLAGLAVLLAHQPRAIGDPGLQLSFAAVAGLFTMAPPLAAWLRGWLPGRVADLAAMAGAAGLATAPVLAWQFGRLSLAGLALNVVAVPLAAPVVVLALAGIAAGALLPAAGSRSRGSRGSARRPCWRRRGRRRRSRARRSTCRGGPRRCWCRRPSRRRWPRGRSGPGRPARACARFPGARSRSRRRRPRLAVWALTRPGPPPPWPAAPAVTALDVGQGDAILLRSPEGAAALVDAGPPGPPAPVAEALARLGVRRLDALILTHDSLDHVGGGTAVVNRVDVGAVLHEPAPEDGFAPAHERVTDAARARGIPVGSCGPGRA